MIQLLRRSDHGWFINKVIDEHNHVLSESCAEKKQWKSHSKIDAVTISFVKRPKDDNISLGRICNIVNNGNTGFEYVRRECVRSVCAKLSQVSLIDNLSKTMDLLQEMMSKDPGMAVSFRTDTQGKLTSMLWVTGKNRVDYSHFGDAITFNTTYRTKLYSLPFGIFVGVNNHFQSVGIFTARLTWDALR